MKNRIKWPLFGFLSKVDIVLLVISIVLSLWIHFNAGMILLSICWMFFIYEQRSFLLSGLANIAMGSKKYNNAIKWYRYAATTTSASIINVKRYVVIGIKYSTVDEVKDTFEKILKIKEFKYEEDIIEIELMRSLILWKSNEIDLSVSTLENVIEKYECDENVVATLAFLKVIKKDQDEYVSYTKKSFEKYPKNLIIRSLYGITLFLSGNIDESRDIFERLSEGITNIPDTFYYYGELLIEDGNESLALEMYKKAMRIIKQTIISTVTEENIKDKITMLEGKIQKENVIDNLDDLDDID